MLFTLLTHFIAFVAGGLFATVAPALGRFLADKLSR